MSMRSPRLLVLIAALSLAGSVLVAGPASAAVEPVPWIQASLTNNWIALHQWPADTALTVTVGSETFSPTTDPGGEAWIGPEILDPAGVHLAPLMTIEATAGVQTKTLILFDGLSLDTIDPVNDTVTGHAPAGTHVIVNTGNGGGGCWMEVVADGGDVWTADFAGLPCGWDIFEGDGAFAEVYDGDGDSTGVEPPPPPPVPWIQTSLTSNWIALHQWPANTELTMTVGGVVFSPTTDPGGEAWIGPETLDPLHLEPLMTIEVTDGFQTKTLILFDGLSLDGIDPLNDIVTGHAPAGTPVMVGTGNEYGGCGMEAVADSGGLWTADFAGPPCGWDILEGNGAFAEVFDVDGDSTGVEPAGGEPPAAATQIQADVTRDQLHLHGWTPDTPVSVQIYDAGDVLLADLSLMTDGGGHTSVGPDQLGLPGGIEPGQRIVVTDGADPELVHELVVQDGLFRWFDPATATVAGWAPVLPYGDVRLHLFDHDETPLVTGAGDSRGPDQPIWFTPEPGEWTFDLSAYTPSYTPTGLLSADFEIADGDAADFQDGTFVALPLIRAWAGSEPDQGWVNSDLFDSDPTVIITVNGGAPMEIPVGPIGEFFAELPLQPTDELVVTGSATGITKTLIVPAVSVDGFDFDLGTVWGQAPPGATLRVELGNEFDGRGIIVHADGTGAWVADFAATGLTLTDDMRGQAVVIDQDTDETLAFFDLADHSLAIELAGFNITIFETPDGVVSYGYEALVYARGDFDPTTGPLPEHITVFINGEEYPVDQTELRDYDGITWHFAGSAMFDGPVVLGEYGLALRDRTAADPVFFTVGVLEDDPVGMPTMTSGAGLTGPTPTFAWMPFSAEYLDGLVDPWAYELNLETPGGDRWVFPIDPGTTAVPFDDPAWQPAPPEPLEPGIYFGTLHSNHQVVEQVPGVTNGFSFEYHRQFQVVVTDGGAVTGGGWFAVDGAYPTAPDLAGPAYFGFNAKYLPNSTVPKGNFELQFHEAGMTFHATSVNLLITAGDTATFLGRGTIDGDGDYGVYVFVVDGPQDMIKVVIWEVGTGDAVFVTDVLPVAKGSIQIHRR